MNIEKKIVLIEDDETMITVIRDVVTGAGYEIEAARNGEDGLTLASEKRHALAVIDVNLPKLGGLEVCRRLRETDRRVSILMLTSRADEVDRVLGLELGADDYLTKPFNPAELLARIGVLLRRFQRLSGVFEPAPEVAARIVIDDLEVDVGRRQVLRAGERLPLTVIEYDIVAYLGQHAGRTVSRAELIDAIWGKDDLQADAALSAHLSRLRSKIEPNPAMPRYILTVKGFGYRCPAPTSDS